MWPVDLPEAVVRHILLGATHHYDLVRHVSVCARVCSEWWLIARGECTYGAGWGTDAAGRKKRARVLRGVSYRLEEAGRNGVQYYMEDDPEQKVVDILPSHCLNLTSFEIGDEGARILGAALQAMAPASISRLFMERNRLTPAGLAHILEAMKRGGAVEGLLHLNLCDNPLLGDEALLMLAQVLPALDKLESLGLTDTGMGSDGMVALCAALPTLPCLDRLDCNSNPAVGEVGWAALGGALPRMPKLDDLYANSNAGMGCAGVSALATGLAGAPALRELHISSCGIGDAGGRALAHVLPLCALTDLNLADNIYSAATIVALERATVHIGENEEDCGALIVGPAVAESVEAGPDFSHSAPGMEKAVLAYEKRLGV